MKDLDSLLKSFEDQEDFHREDPGEEKIVFVHDCYHKVNGKVYEFNHQEYSVLQRLLDSTKLPQDCYQFVAAVKQFDVREDDVSTSELAKHRELLYDDLENIEPDLVIPLGNLAMKALIKKSGITNKRGREFSLGEISVVPTLHPVSLYLEPKLRPLFIQDVDNAYDKVVLGKNKLSAHDYTVCKTTQEVQEYVATAMTHDVVAVDLETEGLDYQQDSILTIGVSYGEGSAFVIPIHHRESPFSPADIDLVLEEMKSLMGAPCAKIFHNCKFDLKFLMNFGVEDFNNIEDTQVMHALLDENRPHGLMEVVKEYFPRELETF